MPLSINTNVFITCAVTGSGSSQDRSNEVPRSPKQIADSAIKAAAAGAAIVHCHVRDPETGVGSRDPKLYRELTERIRDSATDVVLNLTAGMGLLVTGRSVGGDQDSHAVVRNMMCCAVNGQGAGVAAAISIECDVDVADVDIKKVQKKLTEQGARLH